MQRDIRNTPIYQEALNLAMRVRQPGSGLVSDATDLHAAADGRSAVFAGAVLENLEGTAATRVCRIDLLTGEMRVLTFGPGSDRSPRYSPDGLRIAFLSEHHDRGDFQLYLLDLTTGATTRTSPVDGWVEYLRWSPDGRYILLGVAGHGAERSSEQGAIQSSPRNPAYPAWMPTVQTAHDEQLWRRICLFNLKTGRSFRIGAPDLNVWNATWCGSGAIAAVVSPGPDEGLWFSARLALFRIGSEGVMDLHAPAAQLGAVAGAPSGDRLAFVESIASDRGIVAGDLHVLDLSSGKARRLQTSGIDVAHIEWRSNRCLLLAGHRHLDTVAAVYDVERDAFREVWCSGDITGSGSYVSVSGFGERGDCAFVAEGFLRAPEIAVLQDGRYRAVKSLDVGYKEVVGEIGQIERVNWVARDGLEIEGWLIRPDGPGPHPVILNVHGGPVWHWRPHWLGRTRISVLLLARRGYANFFPNPRGSVGQGREYIRAVVGDMGGADAGDLLCGLDHLIERGIADGERIGVTGVSYGGFMSSWLITQTRRFRASIPVSPVNNFVTEHLTSNSPTWVPLFLDDRFNNPGGRYYERSPIMHAHKARTPTLQVCGALDRAAPPAEAMQFHNALLESGVESVLVTYPQEGHGVRTYPSLIDYAARVVTWFEEHLHHENH